jgi:hypothetical protein
VILKDPVLALQPLLVDLGAVGAEVVIAPARQRCRGGATGGENKENKERALHVAGHCRISWLGVRDDALMVRIDASISRLEKIEREVAHGKAEIIRPPYFQAASFGRGYWDS